MSVRVSTRKSIRWLPEPPSEPTDTLVITIDSHYVDLRVSKADSSIDWALAGQTICVSEDPLTISFTHPFDSHLTHRHDEPKPDVGIFSNLPNGDELEVGEMAAPHLGGKVTPYEEVWHELDAGFDVLRSSTAPIASWILESVDDNSLRSKSYYGRAGIYFLVLRQMTSPSPDDGRLTFSALRQEFDIDAGQWATKYSIGDVEGMPSMGDLEEKPDDSLGKTWSVGDQVEIGKFGEVFIVKALVRETRTE